MTVVVSLTIILLLVITAIIIPSIIIKIKIATRVRATIKTRIQAIITHHNPLTVVVLMFLCLLLPLVITVDITALEAAPVLLAVMSVLAVLPRVIPAAVTPAQ